MDCSEVRPNKGETEAEAETETEAEAEAEAEALGDEETGREEETAEGRGRENIARRKEK